MSEKTLYKVEHQRPFGTDSFLLWSPHTPSNVEAEIALNIDFEPEKGEYLVIERVDLESIPVISSPPREVKTMRLTGTYFWSTTVEVDVPVDATKDQQREALNNAAFDAELEDFNHPILHECSNQDLVD